MPLEMNVWNVHVHVVRSQMITRVSLGVGQSMYIWQKVIDTTRQERCKYISSDV